ncbi:MAG: bifunctional (p)ppGpp synthetase/guanosine-3',5'-bis(diphosphate) 3'-pyrophosphohydrolase, partial [Acetobacteraceae bacterium]|nr:bifunctional (p)ppGpp synthetase/guanosine-3',5'-bis(diphosphate) 3'-pyrophosphohydrolase [Acetobacteraceae bacterium]
VRPRGRLGQGPVVARASPGEGRRERQGASLMPVTGLVAGMPYHFAGCCHPLPGERILGIVTTGKGVTIHAADCHTLESFAQSPERFLEIDWDESAALRHVGRIVVETRGRGGAAIGALTETVAQQDGVVTGLKLLRRDAEGCEMAIDVEVVDLRHLERIMGSLRATGDALRVDRGRS